MATSFPGGQANSEPIALTLAGGAMRGAALPGVLQYLEDNQVLIGDLYCVSIGTLVGAFYKNGYTPRQISKVFSDEFSAKGDLQAKLKPILRSFVPSLNPLRWLGGAVIDLLPVMEYLCEKYDLQVPEEGFHPLAGDVLNREEIDLSNSNCDLPFMLASACAVPFLFRPMSFNDNGTKRLLVDYGVIHPHPNKFVDGPIIVTKLFHSGLIDRVWKDRPGQLSINAGDNFMLPFKLMSERECRRLFARGYKTAARSLMTPIANGDVPTFTSEPKRSA